MSRPLQVFILLAIVLYFIILSSFIRRKQLNLKYMLLWIVSGVVMTVFTLFPRLLSLISELLGFAVPVNALFAIALFCTLIILMSLTAILSHQNACLLRLVQENALLEQRIRKLEARAEKTAADEGEAGQTTDEEGE